MWGLVRIVVRGQDSKIAKKMGMCFQLLKAGGFELDNFTALASYPGGLDIQGYSMHATKHGPMHGHRHLVKTGGGLLFEVS